MKRTGRISIVTLSIIVVGLAGIFWPLARRGFYISDDGEWMIIRLSAFYQSLADGQFPVRFLGRLNNSFGYPVANFLYPGFLYIGSLLHVFGFSFVTSVKIILIASVSGAAYFLYAALRRMYSPIASRVGTIAFITSPYVLYDLYVRGSVGEILAFLPASMGLYSIIRDKRWTFALAVALLIVSHNTFALLFLCVFIVFMIAYQRLRFVWQFFLGLLMSAFFWIPALVEKQYVRFDSVTVSNPVDYLLGSSSFWMIGLSGVLCLALLLFGKKWKSDPGTKAAVICFTICAFLVMPQSAIIWSFQPIASLVQFPYRLLGVGSLMTSWIVAAAYEKVEKRKIFFILSILIILVIPAWNILQNISYVRRDEGYYTTNEATTTVRDEYMPNWVNINPEIRSFEKMIFHKGRGNIVYAYLNTQKVVAHVDVREASVIRFQTIYYPGWGITVNGKTVPVVYDNPYGVMEFPVESGNHTIVAEFRETILRFAADIVSLGAVLTWMIFVMKSVLRR